MEKSSEVNKRPPRGKAPAATTFCYTNPGRQRGQDSRWGHPAGWGSTWGLPWTPWPPTFNQAAKWGQQDIMTSLGGNQHPFIYQPYQPLPVVLLSCQGSESASFIFTKERLF